MKYAKLLDVVNCQRNLYTNLVVPQIWLVSSIASSHFHISGTKSLKPADHDIGNGLLCDFFFLDIVEPPVSPVMIEGEGHSHPYVLLFAGGINTANFQGRLEPIYQSSIPNLLGCMRGLMLGNLLIDMRNSTFWPYHTALPG